MTMKKIFAILIACIMILSVASCGGNDTADKASDSPSASTASNSSNANAGDNSSPSASNSPGPNASASNSPSASPSPSPSPNASGSPNASDSGAASDNSGNNNASSGRDTVTIQLASDLGTLSPIGISGDFTVVTNCIYEPMWDMFQVEGASMNDMKGIRWILAESVDVVTPTQWTVHLRQGVKFSNGNPFTASDVLFSAKIYEAAGGMVAVRIGEFDTQATTVIDDYTLDLRFKTYHAAMWGVLSDLVIYDEESYDPVALGAEPIGTGPYKVNEYMVNSHCFLERRDDYWGEAPTYKYLNFRILAEPSQIVNALQAGMVDIATISAQDYDFVKTLPDFNVVSRYNANWLQVQYNVTENSVFNNKEARYAVCHAIDSDAIANIIYLGQAERMKYPNSIIALDYTPAFDNLHSTYSIGYDVALAAQLAESSGLAGHEVRVITGGPPDHIAAAEMLQNMLSQIGVSVVINNYDAAGFNAALLDPTTYDIAISRGYAAGLDCASGLVNGVRFSNILMETPWEGHDRFIEIMLEPLSNPDAGARYDALYELLQIYTNACIRFGICEFIGQVAYAADLDQNSIAYRVMTGVRYTHSFKGPI